MALIGGGHGWPFRDIDAELWSFVGNFSDFFQALSYNCFVESSSHLLLMLVHLTRLFLDLVFVVKSGLFQ